MAEKTAESLYFYFVAQAEGMTQNEMVPNLKGHWAGLSM